MKKTILSLLVATSCMCMAMPVLAVDKDEVFPTRSSSAVSGFKLSNKDRAVDMEGNALRNQIVTVADYDHITDGDGFIIRTKRGEGKLVEHDGHTYLLMGFGRIAKNKVLHVGTDRYISDKDGRLKVIIREIQGSETGGSTTLDTNWVVTGDSFDISAHENIDMYRNKRIHLNGHYYSMDENCQPRKNQIVTYDGGDYITDEQGRIINGEAYKPNLVSRGEDTYITSNQGCIIKDSMEAVDGHIYITDEQGRVIKNRLVEYDGYHFITDEQGRIIKNKSVNHNGREYTLNQHGRIVCGAQERNGLVTIGEHTYFMNSYGPVRRFRGAMESGQEIMTDDRGRLIKNQIATYNGQDYITDKQYNVIKNEWKWNDDQQAWNYYRANGQRARNVIIPIYSYGWSQTIDYAFDSEGKCVNPKGYSHGRNDLERVSE